MRVWVGIVGVSLAACQLNSTGQGSGDPVDSVGMGSDDTSSPTPGTTTGLPPDTESGPGSTGSDPDTTANSGPPGSTSTPTDEDSTGEPATDSAGDPALLVISGGPEHQFGNLPLGESRTETLMVTNEGGSDATGMAGQTLAAPFSYTDGNYPGTGGDCGNTLAPGESCMVALNFTPNIPGLHAATLAIAYDGADDATRDLLGGGEGYSENLIQNPGGEDIGEPPPSWTSTGVGHWRADFPWTLMIPAGVSTLMALQGPNNQDFLLEQTIDVSEWATTIDAGLMKFSFDGQARSWSSEDDYRIRVRYRDAGDGHNGQWDTDWQTSGSWQNYSNDETAPIGTRFIRVELGCNRNGGDSYCDGYFDELVLQAHYP